MFETEPDHVCQFPKDCQGACPECGGCCFNNSACGDPECCGMNGDYCDRGCGWDTMSCDVPDWYWNARALKS